MSRRKGLENLIVAFNKLALNNIFYLVFAYPTSNQEKAVLSRLQEEIKKAKTKDYVKFPQTRQVKTL